MTTLLTAPVHRRFRRKALQAASQRAAITGTLCVGYIRGSTEDQRLTIPTQESALTSYSQRKQLDLSKVFIDSGTCAKTDFLERPVVKEMLHFMAEGDTNHPWVPIQQIVCLRMDRAFRSTVDAILTLHRCAASGVKIHFCEQDIDPNTPMGNAMLQMAAVFAQLETDLRLQRQLETVETMRTNHFKAGFNVPYGWEKVPSATRKTRNVRSAHDLEHGSDTAFDLVPNWEEQDVLTQILLRSEAPLMQSDAEIARILNAAGIRAKKGGKWHPATVYSVRSYARPTKKEDWPDA